MNDQLSVLNCKKVSLVSVLLAAVAPALSGCAAEQAEDLRTSEQLLCSDFVYEAEDMIHTVGGATEDGWNVWAEDGDISTSHDFDGQPAQMTVTARGEFGGGEWPRMSVVIDGAEVANVLVDSDTWTEYTFVTNVPAGTHVVSISLVNDYYQNGEDRNLLVDKLVVECSDDAGTCGDGVVDAGEECDDANDSNEDSCLNDCTLPVCGDGFVNPGEQCDDGNDDDTDGCTSACELVACGDGIVQDGEECDDANDSDEDSCLSDCTLPVCGDGIVSAGELCDDGNDEDLDDCDNACRPTYCGDGIVQLSEECDDSDKDNSDECTNACTLPVCGDGIIQDGEECDDGNDDDTDGCTVECTIPDGDGMSATLLSFQDWGAGYCVNVTVTNGTDDPTTSWDLVLDMNGSTIFTSWNAQLTPAGDSITFTPYGWNSVIAPNSSSTTIGFCANRGESGGTAQVASVTGQF